MLRVKTSYTWWPMFAYTRMRKCVRSHYESPASIRTHIHTYTYNESSASIKTHIHTYIHIQ